MYMYQSRRELALNLEINLEINLEKNLEINLEKNLEINLRGIHTELFYSF